MARLIPMLLLTGAWVSCGRMEDVSGNDEWKPLEVPVRIVTAVKKTNGTKAPGLVVNEGFDDNDRIGVMGFHHDGSGDNDGAWSASSQPNYMYNQLMEFDVPNDDHEGVWNYSPVKYWPNEHGDGATSQHIDKLSFWGYHPFNGSVDDNPNLPSGVSLDLKQTDGTTDYGNSSTGLPYIAFTQSTSGASQADLMVSDLVANVYKNDNAGHGAVSNGEVTLNFSHLLSRVDVYAKIKEGSNQPVSVTSVTVGNLNKTGLWNTAQDQNAEGSWDDVSMSNPVPFTVYSGADLDLPNNSSPRLIGTILPIPQALGEGVTMTLNYKVNGVEKPSSSFVVRTAHTEPFTGWAQGTHYTYTLSIGSNYIEFSASIAPWEGTITGYYPIVN